MAPFKMLIFYNDYSIEGHLKLDLTYELRRLAVHFYISET